MKQAAGKTEGGPEENEEESMKVRSWQKQGKEAGKKAPKSPWKRANIVLEAGQSHFGNKPNRLGNRENRFGNGFLDPDRLGNGLGKGGAENFY